MKSLIIRLVFLLSLFGAFLAPLPHQRTQPVKQQASKVALPDKLIIPSIDVHADIEYVGLDSYGGMGSPQYGRNVAWYQLGARPGEKGSAVIDGHVDFVDGKPAVFAMLPTLKKGDLLVVKDRENKKHTYQVLETKVYDEKDVPLKKIFASNDKAYLNLITCAGDYDETSENYTKRVVVYSELVDKDSG